MIGRMKIDPATGLLAGVAQVLSPHCDARPAGVRPELLVVHGISLPPGEFGGPWIHRLFTGTLPPDAHPFFRTIATQRVSAHALIRRTGQIVQYVPFGERAWHAGQSAWQGRTGCNDFSIGVELEGTDDTPYTDAQYQALAELTGSQNRSRSFV
jgi:AmpD protein